MLAVAREIRRHFYLNSNDMTKAEQPKQHAAHNKAPEGDFVPQRQQQ